MRPHPRVPAIGALLLLVACAGLSARQKLLLPRLSAGWADIATDVALGASTFPEPQRQEVMTQAATLGDGLHSGDFATIAAAPWGTIRDAAMAGIDLRVRRGEISSASAASFRELVSAFDAGLAKFLERGG